MVIPQAAGKDDRSSWWEVSTESSELAYIVQRNSWKLTVNSFRRFRNWWLTLNTAQREKFWNRYGRLFYLIVLAALGVFGVHYYEHLQETPFTKRKRFIAFTDEQFSKIAEFEQVKVSFLF